MYIKNAWSNFLQKISTGKNADNSEITVPIRMVQAIDKYGTFTFVSHDYQFRKYPFIRFIPYCPDKSEYKEIAIFNVVLKFKKAFYESNNDFFDRIENAIYKNLEIYNRNYLIKYND